MSHCFVRTLVVGVSLLLQVWNTSGQAISFVMPNIGESLPTANFELANRIPGSHFKKLPKKLPVFRYAQKPLELATAGLQELIDSSAFKGTNISDLLRVHTNVAVFETPFRLTTTNSLDYFTVDPSRGLLLVFNHDSGVNHRLDTPAYDTIPDFDSIRDRVTRYAQMFGVSTNDMERKDDGALLLRKSDATTVARGGAIKYISRRSVRVSRSVAGYAFLGNDEKIEMVLGMNGKLQQFQMKWRRMEPISTNRLFTVDEVMQEIKNGRVLARSMNEYPEDGIAKITLKDIRIQYYVSPPAKGAPVDPNTDITPVASILAEFRSKSGKKKEGVLFTRIIDSSKPQR